VKITPLSRQRLSPVGLVTGPNTVRGEWNDGMRGGGKQLAWDRIPKGARLFTPTYEEPWKELVAEGRATAIRWKNHGIVSVDFNGARITNLRGNLDGFNVEEQLAALYDYTDFLRENGANTGTISGSMFSLWRATLSRTIVETGPRPELGDLALGGRIESGGRGVFDDVELHDLSAAYAHTIGTLEVPRRWKEYIGPGWDEHSGGFVHARVTIRENIGWGPVGIKRDVSARARMLTRIPPPQLFYPRDGTHEGIWTADEIRGAVAEGCDVEILGYWHPIGARPVFEEWWKVVQEGRESLSEGGRILLKWGANTLWGVFSANGKQSLIWYDGKKKHREEVIREVKPRSPTISGLVAGRVRSRLYREAIAPYTPVVIAANTDGVFLPRGLHPEPNSGEPGTWRIKKECEQLTMINPQQYHYRDATGDHYIVAGFKPGRAQAVFDAKWETLDARPQWGIESGVAKGGETDDA